MSSRILCFYFLFLLPTFAQAQYYDLRSYQGEDFSVPGGHYFPYVDKTVEDATSRCEAFTAGGSCPGPGGPMIYYGAASLVIYSFDSVNQRAIYKCAQSYFDGISCIPNDVKEYYYFEYKKKPHPNVTNNQCSQKASGSDIDVDLRTVGEKISIVGSPFSLNYYTGIQLSYKSSREIKVQIPGDPSGNYPTVRVELYDDTNTLVTQQNYTRPSSAVFQYLWDGKDASGNFARANRKFTVKIFNVDALSISTIFDSYEVYPGTLNSAKFSSGAWLPSLFSYFDSAANLEYTADGGVRNVTAITLLSGERQILAQDGLVVREYYPSGLLHTIRSPLTGTALYTFAYNGSGGFASITDAYSQVTTFNYALGDLTSITAPNGSVTTLSIDPTSLRLLTVTSPNSRTHTMTYYSPSNLLKTFQKPGGEISTFSYDTDGKLTKDSHSGGFFQDLVDASVNPDELVTQFSSRMGRTDTITKKNGYHYSVKADGTSNGVSYNAVGTTSTDRGVATAAVYTSDARFGNQAQQLTTYTGHPSGASPSIAYTDSVTLGTPGDPFTVTNWTKTATLNSKINTSVFTSSNMTWLTTTPVGRTSSVKIDNYERPIEIQQGALTKTELTYVDDKVSQIKRGVRETDFAYNGTTKFLDSITNPLAQTTSFSHDVDGRVTSITLPDLRVIAYGYDANGNITSITPPSKPAHTFTINSRELLGQYTPPAISGISTLQTTYTYNNDNQLTLITRPDASTISYTYHSTAGNLRQIATAVGSGFITYDATTGFFDSFRMPNNYQILRSYSGLLPTHDEQKLYSSGVSLSTYDRTFDSEGRIASDSVAIGATTKTISYGYDNDGNLTSAGALTIAYNSDGLVSGTTMGSITDSYTYNSFGEITGYNTYYSGTPRYSYALTRDDLGRVTQKVEVLGGVTTTYGYGYDSAGRLTSVSKNGFPFSSITWDDNGNRTSYTQNGVTTTASYDDQDRLIANTTYNFAYNDNGEMVSRTNALTSQVTNYTYDGFGQVLSIAWPSVTTSQYKYDGLGRQIVSSARSSVYDFENRVIGNFATATPGTFGRRYVYGSRKNVPDFYMDASGATYRLIYDYLGSIRTVWRVSDGVAQGAMEHDEFGNMTINTLGTLVPFGFAGGLFDSNAKVVHFGARDYVPADGRWLTKDPIRFNGEDTNLYGYVQNDPVNWIDPSGLIRSPRSIFNEALNHPNSSSGTDGPGNAFQHCYASCVMAAENGSGTAAALGASFEAVNNLFGGQSAAASCMDTKNNQAGRDLANENKISNLTGVSDASHKVVSSGCEKACDGANANGRLVNLGTK